MLAERICPAGVLWLSTVDLAHPETSRAARLPFLFIVGRIRTPDGSRTIREIEIVIERLLAVGDAPTESVLRAATEAYARSIVAHAPRRIDRLTGRAFAAFAGAGA
jgi:hypothetical protein